MKTTGKSRRGQRSIMHGAVERSESFRTAPDIAIPPKDMSITERLYYLRERGYGIKTVGCIELARLVGEAEKWDMSPPEFMRMSREISLTVQSMIAQKKEEKEYNAPKK